MTQKPKHNIFIGFEEWRLDGILHRNRGPAVIHNDGYREYWVDGKLHRVGGPAVQWKNGDYLWYIHGKEYKSRKDYFIALYKQGIISESDLFIELI